MSGLVSIIVPVYGAEAYIDETIAMVRKQTHKEWELILIDDCSPDESARVIHDLLRGRMRWGFSTEGENVHSVGKANTFLIGQKGVRAAQEYVDVGGQRIILVCKEQNEGAAAARNTGLGIAEGRYIAFLDADDIWHSDKLAKQMRFMQDRQAGFVFSAYEFGDEKAQPTGRVVHVPETITYKRALSRTVIFTSTVLFDRGRIPIELMKMPAVESEDTATWWQILRAGYEAHGQDEVLVVYRRPSGSLSSNKFTAIRRVWNLYRRQEKLSVIASARYFIPWALRATIRRL